VSQNIAVASVCHIVRYFNGGPPEEVDYGCAVSYSSVFSNSV